jgi:hypothetical protein
MELRPLQNRALSAATARPVLALGVAASLLLTLLPLGDLHAAAAAGPAERPRLVHERLLVAPSGRLLHLRAQLEGASPGARVTIAYRAGPPGAADPEQPSSPDEYVRLPMEPHAAGAFEVWLRPGEAGVPAGGEQVLRYYLEAVDGAGALLDRVGSAEGPIRLRLTARGAEEALAGGAQPTAAQDVQQALQAGTAPEPRPDSPPFYRRWTFWLPVSGALLAGAVVGAILAQPKPQPPQGSLGTVNLP